MKVLLILVDGMRPDALHGVAAAQEMRRHSASCLTAQTVYPSVTLPCHMSLFHSVGPERHGTTTNTYAPQVRPVSGLCEQLKLFGKTSAFFYGWEQLRDLSRPASLAHAVFHSGRVEGYETANRNLTAAFARYYPKNLPDFTFLYYGDVDEVGHACGWMSPEYHKSVRASWREIKKALRVMDAAGEPYTVIVMADHGGHDRNHGTTLPEDMTIPLFLMGPDFAPGTTLEQASILDIAPTAAALLGVQPAAEWEGKSLI